MDRAIWARCPLMRPSPISPPMTQETMAFGGNNDSRSWKNAVARGLKKTCPQCGRGGLFSGYTKTRAECPACGLDLSGHQADDAPPYLTILIVGHISIPLALAMREVFDTPMWMQFSFWGPVILLSTLWLLPISKGAMIGLQWANRMHGFARPGEDFGPEV